MSEIDSLNSMTYAGIQNARNNSVKNNKLEKTKETKKSRFSELIKSQKEEDSGLYTIGLPEEIKSMSIDEAAVFLRDAVDESGNALSEEITTENLERFKKSIKQLITFVEKNNFEITTSTKTDRRKRPVMSSPLFNFGTYSVPPRTSKKTSITVINQKLDELVKDVLERQNSNGNFGILAKINDIKGLVVDLMSS